VTEFEQAVCDAVARLGPGHVVSYGEIAAEVGRPGAARAVGAVLAKVQAPVPWWRVVTSTGRIVPGQEQEHARRLRAEGVPVTNGHVSLGRRHPQSSC
jgi:methylated-DNA-protein-cysteine methyltransferase-like protein